MSCSLASTGQRGHDNHELGKASSISACQHLRGHGDEGIEQHGAHAFTHLAVVSHNVRSEELQQLPVLLHCVQLVWVFGWWGGHSSEPGLQPYWLHTGQLCQRTTQTQQAWVGALLSYIEQMERNTLDILDSVWPRNQSSTVLYDLLSWKSFVKNFRTLLQNLADKFSFAVAIIICTSSPLQKKWCSF